MSAAAVLADYETMRVGAGAVPISRDALRLSGPDAVTFLQGQCSQDVEALGIGDSADALLLTPQGKLDALIRVTRTAEDAMVLDVDGGWGPAVLTRLERFKIRVKATIEALDWSCVALRGPESGAVAGASPMGEGGLVVPYVWGAVSGMDLLGSAPVVPSGVPMCSAEAWAAIRIEAGICVMGAELDERTIAAEADLLERSVSFTKGCYTGQELVARLDSRGNRVARHLRGLVAVDPGATLVPGSDIVAGDDRTKVIGSVTSSALSPGLGRAVGLGYLHRTVEPPTTVFVKISNGADIEVEARELPLTG